LASASLRRLADAAVLTIDCFYLVPQLKARESLSGRSWARRIGRAVIAREFHEADRRDPRQAWVALIGAQAGDQSARGTRHQGRGQIRRQATNARMDSARRPPADEAANYLTHLAAYLDCPQPRLADPSEIVEGACRHFIKDRTDITGARWGLAGAEAILKLRALKTNGDFR